MMTGIMDFLHQAFSMPTAVFSVLLILVIFYWTLALAGLDLGLFGGLGEAADGASEGLVEGVGDVLFESADGLLDGADGLLDGADGADGLLDGGGDAVVTPESLEDPSGIVPTSIKLSLFVLFGWIFSFVGMIVAPQVTVFTLGGFGLILAVAAVSVVLAFGATAMAVRPLSRLLVIPHATTRGELVGRVCTIMTQRVDESFGQAEVVVDSVPLLVQVRSNEPDTFRRGRKALIFQYDPIQEIFRVTPYDDTPS